MSIIQPQFAPVGRSALQCPSCHEHYDVSIDLITYMPKSLTCDACAFISKQSNKNLTFVATSAIPMLDIDTVLSQEWYHTTSIMNDWQEKVTDANVWVHVGRQGTSECIAEQYNEWGVESVTHVLQLNPNLRLNESIFSDANEWPEFIGELGMKKVEEFRQVHRWDAFRYINSYETPGQISLLIKPEAFTIVDTYGNY